MASPRDNRYENRPARQQQDSKESALPIGMWMAVHFREAVGGMFSAEGYVQYCSTYGVRLTMADGTVVYTPHTNVIGAVGERARS